jgi:2-polyprenyl-3-methyl-5-hydroxy-6-metoxy-1,4-benzoquinol methylase
MTSAVTTPTAPAAEVPAFAQKMTEALNGAALMLMASGGHRTGLFDAMASMPPATSADLAAEACLSERYVREWLGAMVAAGVVLHDPAARTYRLPPAHAAWLTRAAGPRNLAVAAQWVAVLGGVEDLVVDAFGHGRGVPYSAYRRFCQVMAEDSAARVVSVLLRDILPLGPTLPARLEEGIDVLDVGCGAAGALVSMAAAYRRSRFTGCDIAADALGAARAEAARRGLRNVRFLHHDAADLAEPAAYDLVMAIDAIHDQARPGQVLSNVAAALRPGGVFFMIDVRASSHAHHNLAHPLGTFLYAMSCMHCVPVSLAGGGPGLGAVWGEELALQMLRDAGFSSVRVERLPGDVLNNYYIAAAGPARGGQP